ncbi:Cro/CI family transcriptional regulator [Stutzerimonas stutzeri]|uniref:XRE family transcriptional regulator n=1 Tax=Stutzerimonas stutzeri subgroup TaxID=578833 RepID=UPI000C6D31B6|nr:MULTISPECIES: LexA family transcriptional regulator [Stutzerimonas stutzeri subgroup]MCQ2048799.1 helix-turn-helix domain-containing protein [Stutzerimonas kunmingensis]PKR26523.1 Cro/Cl family transcriptional regulator [Stutzerimonas stutzeri]QQC13210.1 LexA family transcriptional regulator [Stutzerimonas stutzeri]VEI35380.1 Cro/CI family transcriptional regulator [Stutzerimonas stutzeri]
MHIGKRLAAKLEELGWSEGELKRRSGVSQPTVHRIITGESQDPRQSNVERIAKALGVTAHWLRYGFEEKEHPYAQDQNVEPGPEIVSPYRAVRIVGTAQMGAEGYWHALDEGDGVVDIPSRDPGAYALRLRGDSMAPAIRSGWIAVCEPNGRLVPGEYVMIRLRDGESMLKLLSYANDVEVGVLSVNPAYDMRTIAFEDIEHIHFVGAIVPPSKVRL